MSAIFSARAMAFEIFLTSRIRADKEFVFDWWTDLGPEDTSLVRPLKSRNVVSRTPQLILLRDEEEMYFKRMAFDVRVTLERPDRWTAEYEGKDAHARSEYNLIEQGDGTTTLSYHGRIEPTGFFTNAFSALVKPFVRRVFAREMRTFVRAVEEGYSRRNEWTKEASTREKKRTSIAASAGMRKYLLGDPLQIWAVIANDTGLQTGRREDALLRRAKRFQG